MVRGKRWKPHRGGLKRDMKNAFGEMRTAFGAMMRAALVQQRHAHNARITVIKRMLRQIDVAISRPGSKTALRNLAAIRDQVAEDLRAEVVRLNKLAGSNKRVMVNIRRSFRGPFGGAAD